MVESPDSESERTSASNGSRSPSGTSGGGRHLASYLQSVAQISGIVTIIAATVYALGMFTLALPISSNYHSTFPAAWYAVSVVPKTVVVGHGIKSLLWPSLALTVATMLFSLLVLWLVYIVSIGWHHARHTASQAAVDLTSLAIIYSLLSSLIVEAVRYFPAATTWIEHNTLIYDIPSQIRTTLALMAIPPAILIVLLYSVGAVLSIARAGRYLRRLIGNKVVPSVAFSGFIFKSLIIVWLTIALLSSALLLENHMNRILENGFTSTNLVQGSYAPTTEYLFFVFFLLSVVAIVLLILRWWRYIAKWISEAIRNKAIPSPSASFASLGGSGVQHIRTLASTLLYAVVLFSVFCMTFLLAVNVLDYLVLPLISQADESIKVRSSWDMYFIPLIFFGAFASWVIMYRKGWKGLGRGEYDFLSERGGVSFSSDLLKGIGSRSLRSGLLWSLGVAYVIALGSAFLLAYLNSPPLPGVDIHEHAQLQSASQGQEPGSQEKTFVLLAHTEGYWYLIDEKRRTLLIVPDRDDKFIRLWLHEEPK
jgi:hypothetical protein